MPGQARAIVPFDVAAEEAVIAAFLLVYESGHTDEQRDLAVEGIGYCARTLSPGDFYRDQHAWAFAACIELADRGDVITCATLARELQRSQSNRMPGGWFAWCADLLSRHYTAIGVQACARIVAADAYYRRAIAAADQIRQLAYEGGAEPERIHEHAVALVTSLRPPGVVVSEERIGSMPL